MRVALFNLRYSYNLGDVLLCECLEFGLRRAKKDLDVLQFDITGRRDFARGSPRRLAMLAVLQRLPLAVRQRIARFVIGRSLRRTLPYWRAELAKIDAVVLGGGNLLADSDLNFPLKVAAVFGAVASVGLPAAVYGVGVSDNWSTKGDILFRNALAGVRLVYAAVRDTLSREIWIRRLGIAGISPPQIVRDPGLLAAECYPAWPRPAMSNKRIGICVTHPVTLRYHADRETPGASAQIAWFAELVKAFSQKGFVVSLFTTGSPEDEAYLDKVMPKMLSTTDHPAGKVERVPRLTKAADLAGFVSTLDILTSHRLHACMAAYSFGVPNIGFTWDVKMQSFFDSVGRTRYLCAAVSTPVADVVRLADEALQLGIDVKERASAMAETHRDIGDLLRALEAA
jgi:polysaccharide pyruvyl transferase WcaK-like protein